MDSQHSPIRLHIPTVSQTELSFCAPNAQSFSEWAKSLPMANTGEASRRLYQAIRELNNWKTHAATRFEFLEIIRPYIYSVCTVLNKHFLQSSISLNDKQLKIANLSQALQGHLATGYKLVVAHTLQHMASGEKTPRHLPTALHRAISDSSQTILRAFQLYCQPPERSWLDINQMYLMAEARRLQKLEIEDQQNRLCTATSIKDVFVRIHLLGTVKPSNLRQQDLAMIYEACELWSEQVELTPADDESALFIINLHRDRAGQYRHHLRDAQKASFRSLNANKLVNGLKSWNRSAADDNADVVVPDKMSDTLVSHAVQAWGIHWQRSFRRQPTEGKLTVCVGLSALHYFTAGRRDFEQVMLGFKPSAYEGDQNTGRSVDTGRVASDDIWADAFDAGGSARMPENSSMNLDAIEFINKHKGQNSPARESDVRYSNYPVVLINTSPGGYCLHWEGEVPSSIQAGELIGIQESGVRHWSVGVIRWIRHLRDQGTQLGVELLAPKAEVAAARLLQKTGSNGPQMRALVLPAIKAIAQPATVLLPRIPFRTGNKIELQHNELQGRYQLSRSLTSTSSFGQFQFRAAGMTPATQQPVSRAGSSLIEDDFDSLWNKL
ncbi:hypothetical protein [uncultured Thalassolituus sp.]|uniref:hypothetical protein n=1 Tax=uncultured Thalassolituus sp. TaxID=285273 RepID=UPI0026196B9D|nr:hypothetical protein [uncultured Thalassolituus sp.]